LAGSLVTLFAVVLQQIDQVALHRQTGSGFVVRAHCGAFLRESGILSKMSALLFSIAGDALEGFGTFVDPARARQVEQALQLCIPAPAPRRARPHASAHAGRERGLVDEEDEDEDEDANNEAKRRNLVSLALLCFFRLTVVMPAVTRAWYQNDLTRQQKVNFGKFVETIVRPSSMERELQLIRDAQSAGRWNTAELEVRGHKANGGEVSACFIRDDARVEIKIRVPPQYPLKNVEVECVTKLCVPEAKWRRWSFQIIQLLGNQDGTIIEGVLLWKKNLENEFDGVEPCPICYSTLHYKSMSLPAMTCPTCSNKFHALCLSTWFKQSGKHKCVICQQPFFQG
jgi:hypothetical protein